MWTSVSLHAQTWQHHPLVVSWLWSSTCHDSNSELERFVSVPDPPAQTWGGSQWQFHAQHRGQVPWLVRWPLVAHPPAARNQTHTTVLSLLAWIQADSPFKMAIQTPVWFVQMFFWLQPAWEMSHFLGWGSWVNCRAAVPNPRGPSQAGAGHTGHTGSHAWKGSSDSALLWGQVPKSFNKALLGSTGILPCWGICSLYIYICISLCDCIYTFMHKYVCAYVCVCPVWGDALRKSSI